MSAMTGAVRAEEPANDRLARFRGLAARLDPAGDPARALADGLYVRPTRAAGSRIAAELEISPTSSHMLIGGVGSGKTTELLDVQSRLNRIGDTRALYLDVTRQHDIAKVAPGAVAVQVGLALGAELEQPAANVEEEKKLVNADMRRLSELAHGFWTDPDYDEGDPLVHISGILVPPDQQLAEKVRDALEPMRALSETLRGTWKHIVVLLDGLDRLTDMAAFEQVIAHDIKALGSLGIGMVLVGPLRGLYGMDRTVEQRFDRMHYQPWLDPSSGLEATTFLDEILRKRLPGDALTDEANDALVRASGGVLRDLVALAQLACLEAYLDGAERIGPAEAESAIDAFGRKHMQGLRAGEIDVLQRVRARGTFVHTSEDDLALLMTRRVLEYRSDGRPRYAVHPTIERFLAGMAGEQG